MKTLFRISLLLMCLLFTGTTFAQDAPHQLSGAAWSPDGTMIAVVGNYGTVSVYNADGTLKANMVGHFERSMVSAVTWSPDSTRIASGGTDHDVIIWNVNQPGQQAGEMLQRLTGHHTAVEDVAWSPDGNYLVSAAGDAMGGDFIILWRWNGSAFEADNQRRSNGVMNIAWSPDGNSLMVSSFIGVYVLKAPSLKVLHVIDQWYSSTSADWNSDGTQIAVSTWDDVHSAIRIYDAGSYAELQTLEGGGGSTVDWSPDDTRIASIGRKTVEILDVASEKVIATYPMTKVTMNTSFGWSPDSVYFAYGDTGSAPVIVIPPSASDEITDSDAETPEPAAVAQH